MLAQESIEYFITFGFLHLKSVFSSDEMDNISISFEKIMYTDLKGEPFSGNERHQVYGLIEQSRELTNLFIVDNRIFEVIEQLLGKGFVWIGSDGNRYVENTGWHPDGSNFNYKRIKVIVYLDILTKETGALRVIPGSHCHEFHNKLSPLIQRRNDVKTPYGVMAPKRENTTASGFSVLAWDVPSVALETHPGDLVLFNQNLWHASFFGSVGRRMLTLSFGEHPKNESDIAFIVEMYHGQLAHIKNRQITRRNNVYGDLLKRQEECIHKMIYKLNELGLK